MKSLPASVYRKPMYKAVLTLLAGLMLLASGSANALSLNCERTVESHDAFSTIQAFESWFPKTIRPTKADQIPTSKDTQIRFKIKGAIYDLTPSKWMLGRLPEKGGYKSVTGVRYKCDASSHEVKLSLLKNGRTESSITDNNNTSDANTIGTGSRVSDGLKYVGIATQITNVAELKQLVSRATKLPDAFWKEISQSEYVRRYVSKKNQKVMAGAFPKGCNYRYYWSNTATLSAAISKATSKCQAALTQHNKDFGKNCKCSLVAINNTFIYSDADVYNFDRTPEIPFFAEIESPSGIKNVIRGDAVFFDVNASKGPYEFIVRNERGNKVCDGVQYTSSDFRKGKVSVTCFEGKMVGHGEYQVSDFDHELKTSSGSVLINITDGSVMRAIYGKDALR